MKRVSLLLILLLLIPSWCFAITGQVLTTPRVIVNLRTALTKAGSPVTLTQGTTYLAQNKCTARLAFVEAASLSSRTDESFSVDPFGFISFTVRSGMNYYVWSTSACHVIVGVLP